MARVNSGFLSCGVGQIALSIEQGNPSKRSCRLDPPHALMSALLSWLRCQIRIDGSNVPVAGQAHLTRYGPRRLGFDQRPVEKLIRGPKRLRHLFSHFGPLSRENARELRSVPQDAGRSCRSSGRRRVGPRVSAVRARSEARSLVLQARIAPVQADPEVALHAKHSPQRLWRDLHHHAPVTVRAKRGARSRLVVFLLMCTLCDCCAVSPKPASKWSEGRAATGSHKAGIARSTSPRRLPPGSRSVGGYNRLAASLKQLLGFLWVGLCHALLGPLEDSRHGSFCSSSLVVPVAAMQAECPLAVPWGSTPGVPEQECRRLPHIAFIACNAWDAPTV